MHQTSRRTLLAGAMVLGGTTAAAAQDETAQPIVGRKGRTILDPRDPAREGENSDFLQPGRPLITAQFPICDIRFPIPT